MGEASLRHLIERALGSDEAERYESYIPSRQEREQALSAGNAVLVIAKPSPGACTYMSALWVQMLRDVGIPAVCVAGDLYARGVPAFASPEPVAPDSFRKSGVWDGHCWLALGHLIGDASIFRTAYGAPVGSNLRSTILAAFGPGGDLIIASDPDLRGRGLEYRPKSVLSESEVEGLVRGAIAAGRIQEPRG